MSTPRILFSLLLLALCPPAQAQVRQPSSLQKVNIAAGPEYQTSLFHSVFLGRNWRQEWATAISVSTVSLDTIYGGLQPYARSGGGESKSLKLRSFGGREYAMRSINKSRRSLLPTLLRHSPYGALVQDGISMSHPFAAFALPRMMEAAGILHTNPVLAYVPQQARLDTFNPLYADDLYLLEEKAEGSWAGTTHLGGFRKYMDTEAVKDSLLRNPAITVDGEAFIKARLFDILISDVDRHGGNWSWGVADTGRFTFIPIPGDRDQAFFHHNGLLTKLTLALTRRRWMQGFHKSIRNVATLTSYDQKLDRFFANQITVAQWEAAARALQMALTDSVITASISELPPEVFRLSGTKIIERLQRRRGNLIQYAQAYYRFLAKSVDINGSRGKDWFEVGTTSGGEVLIAVYSTDKNGTKLSRPYYTRTFRKGETKYIRLYGTGGDDVFTGGNKLPIRIYWSPEINKAQAPLLEE